MNNNFVVIDFETGGLDASLHDPVQIAAIILDGKTLKERGRFVSMIKASRDRLTEEALKVNKKTLEEIESAPTSLEVLENFIKFCEPHGKLIPVAHRATFDLSFLKMLWVSNGKDLKEYRKVISDSAEICTKGLAICKFRNKIPVVYDYGLEKLVIFLRIKHENAHDALSDAEATADLFRRLLLPLHIRIWNKLVSFFYKK